MRNRYQPNHKRERREIGQAPLKNDEFRTPPQLGEAMAKAAGVDMFHLDPFAPFHGFSGIVARNVVNWKMDIYQTDVNPSSIGANVPFSEHKKALGRIREISGDEIPVVTIVRASPCDKWWYDEIVNAGFYSWCVFTPRIKFYDMVGEETKGSPSGGIAIVGRHSDREIVAQCVRKHWGNSMAVWI